MVDDVLTGLADDGPCTNKMILITRAVKYTCRPIQTLLVCSLLSHQPVSGYGEIALANLSVTV